MYSYLFVCIQLMLSVGCDYFQPHLLHLDAAASPESGKVGRKISKPRPQPGIPIYAFFDGPQFQELSDLQPTWAANCALPNVLSNTVDKRIAYLEC